MKNYRTLMVAVTFSIVATGCGSGDGSNRESDPPINYTVVVTSVDVVNEDTGESLEVEAVPLQGGTLTVE